MTNLVLIHAFPLTSTMWAPQRFDLSDQVRMFTPNLPGFGGEPRLDGEPFSMEMAARFIQGELDTQKIDRCILGGLSMGGYVAFECWRLFGERIDGLILADTKATNDSEQAKKGRYEAAERIGSGDFAGFCEDLLKKLLADRTLTDRQDLVDVIRTIMRTSPPESLAAALLGMAMRNDSTSMLPEIDVPTALIFGAEDAITTVEEAARMKDAIPQATLTIIESAGHLSNLEQPEQFNAAVMELVKRGAPP